MPARLVVALVALAALAGCSSPQAVTPTPTTATSTPTAEPTKTGLDPDATAADTLAFFDSIVAPLEAGGGLPKGNDVIDALEDAGFDRTLMELTPDKTAIGLDADSIEFSVKQNDACIVGQFGSFGYRSAVLPLLDAGTCLVGATKDID